MSAGAQTLQPYTIATFAGNGTQGYTGDGGAASSAEIANPFGVAVDASGNVYFADSGANVVRVVSASGTIKTFAGSTSATPGYTGDGAAATSATLNGPQGVAVDAAGNVYIADTGNNVIRMVNTGGTISTFAGSSTATSAGDGGAATSAELNSPSSVAVDSNGVVYIADTANNVVRRVTKDGNIHIFAGTYSGGYGGDFGLATNATLSTPEGLAVDSLGNVYVADSNNNVIRLISTSGIITTFAGNGTGNYAGDGGPATSAELSDPRGIALDVFGNLYIADYLTGRIRIVTTDGKINSETVTYGKLFSPAGIAVSAAGNIYVSDYQKSYLFELTPVPQAPSINANGVVSASGFGGFTSITPGTFIEIYGNFLASNRRSWGQADFTNNTAPMSLNGTLVTVGGLPAFVYFINANQVDAVVPSGVASGQQPVVVQTADGSSAPVMVTVNATEPGLLAPASFKISGTQYVVATLTDGVTFILPQNAIPGITSRPAHAGETIVIYGIGFGPVTPNVPAGEIAQGTTALTLPVQFTFGTTAATTTYSGLAPGLVDLYQFNIVVPAVSSANPIPLIFKQGTTAGAQTLMIAVE